MSWFLATIYHRTKIAPEKNFPSYLPTINSNHRHWPTTIQRTTDIKYSFTQSKVDSTRNIVYTRN